MLILKFLKLIRFSNLLIVALTQVMIRYLIILPIFESAGLNTMFPTAHFVLLVLVTMLITGGGYIINDYFDRKSDFVNRPGSVIVGKYIGRRWAITWHIVFNAMALILGAYICYKLELLRLAILFPMISGLLWYYSTSYKKQFLLGNIIVALLTGLVPIMVLVFEMLALKLHYGTALVAYQSTVNVVLYWVSGFAFFALLTNIIREIVKDIEDFEGDNAFGCNTLPIVLGVSTSKLVVLVLSLVTITAAMFVYAVYLQDTPSLLYLLILLVLPMAYANYRLIRADHKEDYHFVSTMLKLVMLFGLLFSIVAYYNFTA